MEVWMAAVFVLVAVTVGVFGQAWGSWLEHKRRLRAMDLIEAELAAGRQPPAELYAQLGERRPAFRAPWVGAIATILVGLAGVLWLVYYSADGVGHKSSIIAVAAVALLALVVTLFTRRGDDER